MNNSKYRLAVIIYSYLEPLDSVDFLPQYFLRGVLRCSIVICRARAVSLSKAISIWIRTYPSLQARIKWLYSNPYPWIRIMRDSYRLSWPFLIFVYDRASLSRLCVRVYPPFYLKTRDALSSAFSYSYRKRNINHSYVINCSTGWVLILMDDGWRVVVNGVV